MDTYDVVVIGGSAAGLPAALTARRHYPGKKILLIRKEEKVLIPCGIPYIFGTVETPENNLIPNTPLEKNNIDLWIGEAESVSCEEKTVRLTSGAQVSYDKLVLATGSQPFVPPIPGIDKENVFPVIKDVVYLEKMLDRMNKTRNLIILGGGFIGVEFADECKKKRDINVTVIELLDQCLQLAFGESNSRCSCEVEAALMKKNINVLTGTKLEEVLGNGGITGVRLSDSRKLDADALIVGVGVTPNTDLAEKAGLETDKYGIIVDSAMRTSDPDIFACGDCTKKTSFFTGKPCALRLASIASTEARVAGANLFAARRSNPGVVGIFSTAIDHLTVGCAGLSETDAENEGFDVAWGEAEAADRHPGKMPGMSSMWVKLVFNARNGELIGGTVKGGPSAGELINTISACIQKRMNADDIATFQIGTHPAVTASPIAYQLVNAAEAALQKMKAV